MQAHLDTFRNETLQVIQELEEHILDLDNSPQNIGKIDAVFRTLHSLKGSAAMFEFTILANTAHSLENLFEQIRNGSAKFNDFISDICLDFAEFARNVLFNTQSESILQTTAEELNARINEITADALPINIGKTKKTFRIRFEPNADFELRGIDIYQVFDILQAQGQYVILDKQTPETPEFAQKYFLRWEIFISSVMPDELFDGFLFEPDEMYADLIAEFDCFEYPEFEAYLTQTEHGVDYFKVSDLQKFTKRITLETATPKSLENTQAEKQTETSGTDISNALLRSEIKLSSEKLDVLMNLVSELVSTKEAINLAAGIQNIEILPTLAERLDGISRKIQDTALSMRLLPLRNIISKLEITARKLAKKQNKKLVFETDGTETELDKTIIENIADPLLHIIRNSIDHGIEPPDERAALGKPEAGRIKLFASYTGDNVIIQIHDDGRGISPDVIEKRAIERGILDKNHKLEKQELLNLIFTPGFTTAKTLSDVSGRGVGLDIVRTNIADLRGEVELASEIGLGTYITLKLPLTLSIVDTLHILVNKQDYLIPKYLISKVDEISLHDFTQIRNNSFPVNGQVVPFINLQQIFGGETNPSDYPKLIHVTHKNKTVILTADSIAGDHQAVLKPLGDLLKDKQYFSGASILGNGALALMLDLNKLLKNKL